MGLRGLGAGRQKKARADLERDGAPVEKWRKVKGRAKRMIGFLEGLPITKGKYAGRKMKLLPEQLEFVQAIYSEKKRVRLGILSEPRGNGKTGLLAGLCLAHMIGPEAEPRGEVYAAAIDRQQAGIMYNEVEAIILAVPAYSVLCNLQRFHKRIEVWEGEGRGSLFEALSSDARRAHGLAPTLWVYDELAQAKDRELLDNLQTAMGKRDRSLGIVISTQAPDDEHPLSQLIDDGLHSGDPSIVVRVISAPEDADAFSPKTLKDCNPAFDKFLDAKDLLSEQERAKRAPAFEPRFRNLRLNQRVDASEEARILSPADWKRGSGEVHAKKLKGRECFGGLDLSGKHDLCALELIFPDGKKDVGYDVLSFFWTPEGQLERRSQAERDRFKEWIRAGCLTSVPGPVVKFGYIARQIMELAQLYKVRAIGYDRWRIEEFKLDLEDLGGKVNLIEHGQGFKDMGPAVEFFAEKALAGLVRHGGHPVLTACVANAIVVSDPAGNQKFDKAKSNKGATIRIDGAVALAMAFGVARKFQEEPAPSYQMMFV